MPQTAAELVRRPGLCVIPVHRTADANQTSFARIARVLQGPSEVATLQRQPHQGHARLLGMRDVAGGGHEGERVGWHEEGSVHPVAGR